MYDSPTEIVRDFPTAKPTVKRLIKEKNAYLEAIREWREDVKMQVFEHLTPNEIEKARGKMDMILDLTFATITKGQNIRTEAELDMLVRLLKAYEPVVLDPTKPNHGVTAEQIARAKLHPIHNLIKVNGANKAICPFHNDTHASLHYYKKENRVHCFVCEWNGDVIDMYMKLNNLTMPDGFPYAVKALI